MVSTSSRQAQPADVTSEVESLSQLTEDQSSSAPVGLSTIFRPRNDKYEDTTSTDESRPEDGTFPNGSTDTIGELVSVRKAVDNMVAESENEDSTHYNALEPTMTSNSSLVKSARRKKKPKPEWPEVPKNKAHDLDSYLEDVSISSWSSRSYYQEPEYDPLTEDFPSPKRSSSTTSSAKKAAARMDKQLAMTIARRSDPAGNYKSMSSKAAEDTSPARPISEKEKRMAVALTCPPRPWWLTPDNSSDDEEDADKPWLLRNRGYVLCFMVCCFVAGSTISLCLLFTNRHQSTDTSHDSNIDVAVDGPTTRPTASPTPSPVTVQLFTPEPTKEPPVVTDVPTGSPVSQQFPTSFPTAFPTIAPTSRTAGLRDWILQRSPESQDALTDPLTPQSMAMEAIQGQQPDIERYSLLTLKYAFNMSDLDTMTHICRWEGVTCDGSWKVIGVDWSFSAIDGTLPAEVGLLEKLEVLNLAGSSTWGGDMVGGLYGTLPDTIGRLTNLEELILYDSDLTSTIPPSLFQATALVELQLSGNSLTGTLSSAVGELTNLRILDLGSNEFRGSIPTQLSQLRRLQLLNLRRNALTGSIPNVFDDLNELQELLLDDNTLFGSIPFTLFRLPNLGWLALNDNRLNGFIPNDVGQLSNLQGMEVQHNRFRGLLPAQLALLEKMRVLDVSHNFLTGTVDSALGSLPLLAHLSLDHNRFQGQVPLSICDMTVAGGPLVRLEADCGEVTCTCCTRCYNVN